MERYLYHLQSRRGGRRELELELEFELLENYNFLHVTTYTV